MFMYIFLKTVFNYEDEKVNQNLVSIYELKHVLM